MVLQCIPHLAQMDLRPFFEGLQNESCMRFDTMRVPISMRVLRVVLRTSTANGLMTRRKTASELKESRAGWVPRPCV